MPIALGQTLANCLKIVETCAALLVNSHLTLQCRERHLNSAKPPTPNSSKVFLLGFLPLDSNPLNRNAREPGPASQWDIQSVWIDPGYLTKALMLSAGPFCMELASAIVVLVRVTRKRTVQSPEKRGSRRSMVMSSNGTAQDLA
jgi:hypothetical protein